MTDAANFGRDGELPKPKKPLWRSSFGLIVLYICIAGIIAASEIGSLIIIMSMITFIGIPIAFLVMAIPTAAIIAFTTWVFHRILRFAGYRSLIPACLLALAFLAGYPPVHNFFIKAEVKQLVELDQLSPADGKSPTVRNKVFGYLANGRRAKCNSFCQRVLLSGDARTYLGGHTSQKSLEPKLTGTGWGYTLIKRNRCTLEEEQNLKLILYSNKDVAAELAMRAKLESGYCLAVDKKMPMKNADTILHLNNFWGRPAFSVSHNPFAQLVFARRLSFLEKNEEGEFDISVRQTLVDYSYLGQFISVVYRGGSGLMLRSDLWRYRHQNYDREAVKSDLIGFLEKNVGISLELPGFEQNEN